MSRWKERFEGHAIHETIRQSKEWLDTNFDDADPQREIEKRRLLKFLDLLESALSKIDPELYPENVVNSINSHLRQPNYWNQLKSYASNGKPQHLISANDHASQQLGAIHNILPPTTRYEPRKIVSDLQESFDDFCSSIDEARKELSERIGNEATKQGELSSKLESLSKSSQDLDNKLQEQISSWQTEFKDKQNERAEEYSNAKIERQEEFDQFIRSLEATSKEKINDIVERHRKYINDKNLEFMEEVDDVQKDISEKHRSIIEIHQLVGYDGVAGGYQKGAQDEKKQADTWRIVAMSSLGIAAAWLLIRYVTEIWMASSSEFNWHSVIITGSIGLVLIASAGYASRQSKIHRDSEHELRRFALEVQAIDPFISSLPSEQQNEIKTKLTERLFIAGGSRAQSNLDEYHHSDPNAVKEIGRFVLDQIGDILKKGNS